jgi:predicted nucleic acid-binding protein
MDKLFLDTNIILDLIEERAPFYIHAQQIFSKSDKNKIQLCTSSLNFANLHFIITKKSSKENAVKILLKLKTLIEVLPLDDKVIHLALASDFRDFEDAIQFYTAVENNISILITRNLKDFKKTDISVMTAEQYLGAGRILD